MVEYSNDISKPIHITLHPFRKSSNASHACYTAADVISGIVRVDPQTRPQRVNLTFKGRCEVEIPKVKAFTGGEVFHEATDFFSYTLELFYREGQSYDIINKGTAEDGKVEYPFTFAVPPSVELTLKTNLPKRPDFENDPGFPLPPNFSCKRLGKQKIEYFLEASLYTKTRFIFPEVARQNLIIQPYTPSRRSGITEYIPPTPEHVRCTARTLYPRFDPNEGVRGKLKRYFNNEVIPPVYANFMVSIDMPQTVHMNSILPMTLNLTHGERSPEIPEPPPIYLRRIRVKIVDNILTRASRTQASAIVSEAVDVDDLHKDEKIMVEKGFVGQLVYDGLKIQDMVDLTFRGTAPDFKSYTLSLTHDIEVKVQVSCAGEVFRLTVCKGCITVLPEIKGTAGQGQSVDSSVTRISDVPNEIEDGPPAYQPYDRKV